MEELIKKYNIEPVFYRRYFRYGAEMLYAFLLQNFFLFKKGKFLNPIKKKEYFDKLCREEIVNFYENGFLRIPKVDFDITTRCTLKCKYCSNMMPKFRQKNSHVEMSYDDFKNIIDVLFDSKGGGLNRIDIIQLIGGEPLLHKQLPEIIEYAAKNDKIGVIKIITNATILPSEKLIETIKKYNDKVYFYISNYSTNPELKGLLKFEEFQKILDENKIKYQTMQDLSWDKEGEFKDYHYDEQTLKQMFASCVRSSCLSIINNKLHICAKSASGNELGLIDVKDCVNLKDNPNLRQDIIDFYKKDYYEACKYCAISEEKVIPAQQVQM